MINYDLFEYQSRAVDELMDLCIEEPISNEHIVLQAPTGSGKTIILSSFIDAYLDSYPNTIVFWLCPGTGGLETQSKKSFEEAVNGWNSGDVYDFLKSGTHEREVFFINWEMITGKKNIVLKEAEWKNLYEKVRECHDAGNNFVLIVDEEHSHNTEKANHVITQLLPVQQIRASATANTRKTTKHVIVKETEVIDSGMIAEAISINQDLPEEMRDSDVFELIRLANLKRLEVSAAYENHNVRINPLVLVQFPNGDDETIAEAERCLAELGFTVDNGMVGKWFSGDRTVETESLKDFQSDVRFLLFKQAIATGWDCPRAKILVKLREGGEETFNIQTIGRIRRMPERKHYDDDILDKCYLYTRDSKFETGLKETLTATSYNERTYKSKINQLKLVKEYVDEIEILVNEREVFEAIKSNMVEELDDNHDGLLSQKEMERNGYSFSKEISSPLYQGLVHTLHELGGLKAERTSSRLINTHIDGFVFKQATREIGKAGGLSETTVRIVLASLFDKLPPNGLFPEMQSRYDEALDKRLFAFPDAKSYYAFIINNQEKLKVYFKEANADEVLVSKGVEAIKAKDWSIPERQVYRYDDGEKHPQLVLSNVFEEYNTTMYAKGLRSSGEELFERWCEANSSIIDFYYRNGDKGEIYFSYSYQTRFQIRNCYPDYIVQLKNGDTWIIEVKGGMLSDGSSGNIDAYASHKFAGILDYKKKHENIKIGFARPYAGSLKVSTTKWEEDLKHEVWEPIENVVK